MIKLLKDLPYKPYDVDHENGKHWRHFECSVILSSFPGIHSNGVDTYEIMLPNGEVLGYQTINEINKHLILAQISEKEALKQFPELFL